ncbi:FMN reductase (NADPH) [Salinibacillus kushneri]|uniref:FMN reductase (NADPH) n=1 Tax=Salinibacillus kushneri TaxID=237682 RepID=A0A1I0IAK5_9BACI|nr:oxygen-insensitive NADPH nitroreductase [Salinibacillus kushneri]SET93447.1 FMN reductase (NADPH) [Salinibacillus kushneri]
MNQLIDTLLNHRSIRQFKDQPLSKEQIHTIVQSAQQASTSSYYQAYSIIGVTDEDIKQALSNVSGQFYVKDNAHLMVFCADFHRAQLNSTEEQKKTMNGNLQNTEHFIVATVDAALAAQNAAIAAESMGLGICYLGSLRNDINQVSELLQLPDYVIPLFGMAIGYPDHQPERKPRLPMNAIYFENHYANDQTLENQLDTFNNQLNNYYQNRSENKRTDSFTGQIHRKLSKPKRQDVTDFVKHKGMNRK